MKKVMMALPELDVGGAQILTLNLIREIRKKNANIQFQILVLGAPHGTILEKQCLQEKIEVIYLGKKKGLQLEIIPEITKAIKRFGPDVIHMHKSRMHYFLLPILCSGVKKRLYTVHNLADMDTKSRTLRKLMSFAFRHCHVQPVAISALCQKTIEETYGILEREVPCIYNGINIARFSRPWEYEIKTPFCFAAIGRLSTQKNYPLMLRAFADIHHLFPDTELVIMGDGDLRATLDRQCGELGVSNAVHFTGNISNVETYLWTAQAYLMSSDYEGLPHTLLEAMAAGLPIISTRAGGIVDVVENEKNGLLVNCGDLSGLKSAMEHLLKSPALCRQFSDQSAALAQKYSIQACAEQYKELYLA